MNLDCATVVTATTKQRGHKMDVTHAETLTIFGEQSPLNGAEAAIMWAYDDLAAQSYSQHAFAAMVKSIFVCGQSEAERENLLNFTHGFYEAVSQLYGVYCTGQEFEQSNKESRTLGFSGITLFNRPSPLDSLLNSGQAYLLRFMQDALLLLTAEDMKSLIDDAPNAAVKNFMLGVADAIFSLRRVHEIDLDWQDGFVWHTKAPVTTRQPLARR